MSKIGEKIPTKVIKLSYLIMFVLGMVLLFSGFFLVFAEFLIFINHFTYDVPMRFSDFLFAIIHPLGILTLGALLLIVANYLNKLNINSIIMKST